MRRGQMWLWVTMWALLLLPLPSMSQDLVDNPAFQGWQKFRVGSQAQFRETRFWEGTEITSDVTFTLLESTPDKVVLE